MLRGGVFDTPKLLQTPSVALKLPCKGLCAKGKVGRCGAHEVACAVIEGDGTTLVAFHLPNISFGFVEGDASILAYSNFLSG